MTNRPEAGICTVLLLWEADGTIPEHEAAVPAEWLMPTVCCAFVFQVAAFHYSVTSVLLPSLIPDLSSWFPGRGSCPATKSLLHQIWLCPHVLLSGDGWLSECYNLSMGSPSLRLTCNHSYFLCHFCDLNVLINAEVTNVIITVGAQAPVLPVLDVMGDCCVSHTGSS